MRGAVKLVVVPFHSDKEEKVSRIKRVAFIVVVLGGVIQLYPVERTNPPVLAGFTGPEDVKEVLRTACYDCHSNETKWPLYSYVAPISWLVADDVAEGREHMNLSEWGSFTAKKQAEFREEIWEEVEEGEMPLPIYLPTHPEADLSEDQRRILKRWSESGSAHRDTE